METVLKDMPNMFAKANFSFTVDGKSFDFINQYYSVYGISGIRWTLFDPRSAVGQKTEVTLEMLTGNKRRITLPGIFTAERSKSGVTLGIRFVLSKPEDRRTLEETIMSSGTVPTTHIRKYPRIPAHDVIATMPLNAIMNFNGDFISTQIANLSPNGVLLCTENPKAALIDPDMRIKAQLEPRGDFFMAINFEGMVCRITEDVNLSTKNIQRYLGIRFMRFDDGHKESFIGLLQDILLRLKIAAEKAKK